MDWIVLFNRGTLGAMPERRSAPPIPDAAPPFDRRLLKAISHPVRWRIMQLLLERVASPVQLSREIDQPLGTVSYHVRVLVESGCVELARTRPRRGATEHFYRALFRPTIGDRECAVLPPVLRNELGTRTLADLLEDAGRAATAGAFGRDDVQIVRTLVTLDEPGWKAMAELMAETLERALRIEAGSANRRAARADAPARRGELGLLLFERA